MIESIGLYSENIKLYIYVLLVGDDENTNSGM